MKQFIAILALALCSCSGKENINLSGRWMEVLPQDSPYVQGMDLKENGSAESVGMKTLLYHQWKVTDYKLILTGESIGNGQTIQFTDTMNIIRCHNDTLIVKKRNREIVFVKDPSGADNALQGGPSREAYEGFVWKKLSGAGLTLWVQENDEIRLLADSSLPGIVMVRKGAAEPRMLIRIFDLPNKDINDVINTLERTTNWDKKQPGRFEEVKSGREGVKRFVMIPDGQYATEIETQMKSEPVPAPCNGWGVGNSGQRYFEIDENYPNKALFLEIGQEAPLFDENSIVFSDSEKLQQNGELSKDELYTLKGTVVIGHEVRSFKPDGCDEEYWIVDKTGTLNDLYDRATNGQKNGQPLQAVLKVEYNGKWDDGFAAEYAGVCFVREVKLNK